MELAGVLAAIQGDIDNTKREIDRHQDFIQEYDRLLLNVDTEEYPLVKEALRSKAQSSHSSISCLEYRQAHLKDNILTVVDTIISLVKAEMLSEVEKVSTEHCRLEQGGV
jgi:hypothetical protein